MSVPSGWYPDPAPGSSLQRFWDGTSWTSQTREAPGTAAEPEAHAAASAPSVPAEQPAEEEAVVEAKKPRRSRRRRSAPSYGSRAAVVIAALVWMSATAMLWVAPQLSSWPSGAFAGPTRWVP